MTELKIVERIEPTAKAANTRRAALRHARSIKDHNNTKGIFLSEDEEGLICHTLAGVNVSEAISMLEEAKYNLLKDKWG